MRKILSTVLCLILAISSATISVAAESDSSKETNKVQVSESKVALVDTATDLVKMSLSDVIDMFGGEFDVKTSQLNQNVVYDLGNFAYITNEDVLPGMLIYTDYFLGAQEDFHSNFELTNTAAEKAKSELLKGNNNITHVVAQKNAKFDSKISADMNYKQMKEVIGDFECFTNSGHGTYFMNTEPTGGYSVLCSFNYTTNIQAEDYATIDSKIMEDNNPNLDFILVNTNYTTIYRTPTASTPAEKTYTAVELVNKTVPEIIDIMGGYFQFGSIQPGNSNERYFVICNPETLPRFQFILNGLKSEDFYNNEAVETENIKSGKYDLKYIDITGSAKLDNNISADMRYNDLTKYYGNFNCQIAGAGNVVYSVKNSNGKEIAEFIFNYNNVGTSYEITSETMKTTNPQLKQITVFPGFESSEASIDTTINSTSSTTSSKSGSTNTTSATTGTTSSKSGSTSSTGSTVTSPKTGVETPILGSAALLILSGTVAGVLSKKRKEEN